MNDENTGTGSGSAEASKTQEQTTGQTPVQGHDDFNAAAARKKLKALERQNAELEQKLAERAEAEKSEEEKKLTAARKEGRAEVESELAKIRLDHALERELLQRGLDPVFKHIVLAKGEVTSEEDIADAVTAALADKAWAKPAGVNGGQGIPPRNTRPDAYPRGGEWDQAQIAEVRASGQWAKYKDQILAWSRGGR